MGTEKLASQRNKWRRKVNQTTSSDRCELSLFSLQMKSRMQIDSKLTADDKTNLSMAIKQTIKLSKFSLRKRINVLKNEWWYWDDIMQATLINGISTEDDTDTEDNPSALTKQQENDTEEILQLLATNPSELVVTKSR